MENQSKKSNWEDLARELGAETPESTSESSGSGVSERPGEYLLPPRVALPEDPPRAAPAGWDLLASEFGIDSPSELCAEKETQRDSHSGVEFSKDSSSVDDVPPSAADTVEFHEHDISWSADDMDSVELEASSDSESGITRDDDSGVEEARSAGRGWGMGDDIVDDSEDRGNSDEDLFGADLSAEVESIAADQVDNHQADNHASSLADTHDKPTEPSDSEAPKPALSFWESIFGPRQEEAPPEPIFDAPPKQTDDGERDDKLEDENSVEMDSGAEVVDEEELPRRRSRRGRRGRGRSRTGEETRHEDGFGVPARERNRSRAGGDAERTTADASADDDRPAQRDRDRERVTRAKPSSHRNLPSWDDAISVIVESNLAARAEHRRSTSRTSGRSRPRGRRKKKS